MIEVRREAPGEVPAIRAVHALAFARPDEGGLVDALRERVRPYIGLVAVEHGDVVGHVALSAATLQCYNAGFPILALGPLAVRPDSRRRGIGSALVSDGLAACRRLGYEIVVAVGHPGFYSRVGFVAARPLGLLCEFPVPDDSFLVAEMPAGAIRNRRGVVLYAREFARAANALSAWSSATDSRSRRSTADAADSR